MTKIEMLLAVLGGVAWVVIAAGLLWGVWKGLGVLWRKGKGTGRPLSCVAALLLAACCFLLAPPAARGDQIFIPSNFAIVTNINTTGATNGLTTGTATDLVPFRDYMLTVRMAALVANSSGSNVTIYCDLKRGTNWTTGQPISFAGALSSTSDVVISGFFGVTNFTGASAIRMAGVLNMHSNAVAIKDLEADVWR